MYDISLTTSYFPAQMDAEIRDITVGQLLRATASVHPDLVAMLEIDDAGEASREWTYSDLLVISNRLAQSLASRFSPGERVVVWAPNIPEWIFIEYACGLTGLVLITANPSFQSKELHYGLVQSRAVALFIVDEFRGNPMRKIAEKAAAGIETIREVINLIDGTVLHAKGDLEAGLPAVAPDDAAQIQYTSGTTGFPKGAVLSHKNLVNNAHLYCTRKKVGWRSIWANFMPLFHTAGCATGALGCLQAASKMLLIKQFNADVFAKLI